MASVFRRTYRDPATGEPVGPTSDNLKSAIAGLSADEFGELIAQDREIGGRMGFGFRHFAPAQQHRQQP